jgi:RNA polymerase sigma-70 factor (ECF subfamily)
VQAKPLTEEQIIALVAQAQEGDTKAFGQLYDHFFDSVYRYAAFRLPREVCEDTVADVFVKAWEKIHTYHVRKGIPFGAWLFRIVRHTVIDTYRKRRDWEEVSEDLPDEDAFNRTEARVKRQHLLKTMRGAMDRLPSRYREVLHLSYVADLPGSEVARVMRTSEGSVRTLKFRALRKLEEELPPDIHDNGV